MIDVHVLADNLLGAHGWLHVVGVMPEQCPGGLAMIAVHVVQVAAFGVPLVIAWCADLICALHTSPVLLSSHSAEPTAHVHDMPSVSNCKAQHIRVAMCGMPQPVEVLCADLASLWSSNMATSVHVKQ